MIYTAIAQDFSEIKILSTTNIQSTYPVIKLFDYNYNVVSVHAINGIQNINGTTYTTTPQSQNLLYNIELTSLGNRFTFDLNATTIGKPLEDGVYEIELISEQESFFIQVFLYKNLQCCLAKKISKPFCKVQEIEEIVNMTAIIEAVNAATNSLLFEQAVCGFKMLKNYCNDCGCK